MSGDGATDGDAVACGELSALAPLAAPAVETTNIARTAPATSPLNSKPPCSCIRNERRIGLLGGNRKYDSDNRSVSNAGFDLDISAVQLDRTKRQREAKPASTWLGR